VTDIGYIPGVYFNTSLTDIALHPLITLRIEYMHERHVIDNIDNIET
jgi:hypothetical protein